MQNQIYLRRALKVILPPKPGETPINVVASFNRNIEQLGFRLSPELFDALRYMDAEETGRFYHQLIKNLKLLVGAHRSFSPMYPNFPAQVMDMERAELYLNALGHYLTHELPASEVLERSELKEAAEPIVYRVIELGDKNDFEALCARLLKSKTPFSVQDTEDVRWIVSQYQSQVVRLLPDVLTCKENIALLGALLWPHLKAFEVFCTAHVKTATDVLRLVVAVSQGDVSLAQPCWFKNFSRSERVALLAMLERMGDCTEDMLRWKTRWVRLGERLHPGDYTKRFPKVTRAFDMLRNGLPVERFNREVEGLIAENKLEDLLRLLEQRPGEFARRLDHLLRLGSQLGELYRALGASTKDCLTADAICVRFGKVVDQVATPVLLQIIAHFRSRDALEQPDAVRTFFPKGEVAKVFSLEQSLPALDSGASGKLVDICKQALVTRFALLPPLGRCYIDPLMRDFLVPFSQRSASKSLRTLVRGSRLALPDCKALRFFIWWKNGRGRVDIDLSAAMFDDKCDFVSVLAYYNLNEFGAYHSGDVVDAPQGACEFIDIDLQACRRRGIRYVVMSINSYTSQPFCDLPECFGGWMGRQNVQSGEIFEPRLVVDKVDVASNTQICLPAIFDIEKQEVIWADIALTRYPRYVNNVHGNLRGVSLMLKAMTQLKKMDLYTLFDLHVRARGARVNDKASAEHIFSLDEGVTPFDLDLISAQYL